MYSVKLIHSYIVQKGYTSALGDVTLIGVMQVEALASIPGAGDEGEYAAVIECPLQLHESFVHCCQYTNVNVHVASVYFHRHSILDMVLKIALMC
jgi:hypothetical protein